MSKSRSSSKVPKDIGLNELLNGLTKLYIDDLPYRVVHAGTDAPLHRADPALGVARMKEASLTVDRDMTPEVRLHTLLHEWVHAVIWSRMPDIPQKYWESMCDGVAGALLSLIRQNPQMIALWIAYLEANP